MLATHGLQNIEGTTEPALPSAGDAPSTPAEQQHFNIRSLLGSCAYLADTVRPDIATASSTLASAIDHDNVTVENYRASAHLAAYLKNSQPHAGLKYNGRVFDTLEENLLPRAFCESD